MTDVLVAGSVTNPAAAAAIATTASLGAGRYLVAVATAPTGTLVGAGDLNNIQLQVGAVVVGPLLMAATAGVLWPNLPVEVSVPIGGATVSVTAIGNASGVSAVYNAQLVVRQIAKY